MTSAGPSSPGTLANLTGRASGVAWVDPGNAAASDDTYVTITLAAAPSEELVASNFGFAIPLDAHIDGLLAEVEIKTATGNVTMRGRWSTTPGTIAGASPAPTPGTGTAATSEAYVSFGASTDLDREWTPAMVNDSSFCFQLRTNGNASDTISVDHIRVTVYYTERVPSPEELEGEMVGLWDGRREQAAAVAAAQQIIAIAEAGQEWIPVDGTPVGEIEGTGRIRVDVYSADGTKLSIGPIVDPLSCDYSEGLDRLGGVALSILARDAAASSLAVGQRLHFYREGEGQLPIIGIIDDLEWPATADGAARLNITGTSLAGELAWVTTGIGKEISDVTPAGLVAALLNGTDWSAGDVDTSAVTLRRRYDGATIVEALVDAAEHFGFHVRFNDLTRTVDLGAFGADSGQVFSDMELPPSLPWGEDLEVLPLLGASFRESAAELWNRLIVVGAGKGWAQATMIVRPAKAQGLEFTPKIANGDYPLAGSDRYDDQGFELDSADPDYATGWTVANCSGPTITTSNPYQGDQAARFVATAGAFWYFRRSWPQADWPTALAGALAGHTARARVRVRGVGTAIGKDYALGVIEDAGGGGSSSSATSFTATAAWQLVEHSRVLTRADATSIRIVVESDGGEAIGDELVVDNAALWDADQMPYPVEHDVDAAGQPYFYLEDSASVDEHGMRTRVVVAQGIYPRIAGVAEYRNVSQDLARRGGTYLARHAQPAVTASFETTGLHRGVAYPVALGDTARVRWRGVAVDALGEAAVFKDVDRSMYLLGYSRRFDGDGGDVWSFEASSIDAHRATFEERFVDIQQSVGDLEVASDSERALMSWSLPRASVTGGSDSDYVVASFDIFNQVRMLRSLKAQVQMDTGANSLEVRINGVNVTTELGGPWTTVGSFFEIDLTPAVVLNAPAPTSATFDIAFRPTNNTPLMASIVAEVATGTLD